jgi:hypothetical protein
MPFFAFTIDYVNDYCKNKIAITIMSYTVVIIRFNSFKPIFISGIYLTTKNSTI